MNILKLIIICIKEKNSELYFIYLFSSFKEEGKGVSKTI